MRAEYDYVVRGLAAKEEVIKALEGSARELASQFSGRSGESAFDYPSEAELQAKLFTLLRDNKSSGFSLVMSGERFDHSLVRLEWQWRDRPQTKVDLVLVSPDTEEVYRFREGWDARSKTKLGRPRLLVACELKRGRGGVPPRQDVQWDLEKLSDIGKSPRLGMPVTYFLCFSDEDYRGGMVKKVSSLERQLADWVGQSPKRRRVMSVTRDGRVWLAPDDGWLTQPVPNRQKS
jgi:hypothetical protein